MESSTRAKSKSVQVWKSDLHSTNDHERVICTYQNSTNSTREGSNSRVECNVKKNISFA